MKSKEEAQAAGEKLKEFLLELMVVRRKMIGKLDGSEVIKQNGHIIDQAIQDSREVIKSQHEEEVDDNLYLSKGRSARKFDFECSRLWERALDLYIKSSEKALEDNIARLLND